MDRYDELARAEAAIQAATAAVGTRLRIKDVAALAGISKRKVLDDYYRGQFAIVKVQCGQRWRFEVEPSEAKRYLAQLLHAA